MTISSQIAQIAPISPDWRHLAQSFCKLGASDEQLAELFGVSEETLVGWMAEIPDFADAVRAGRTLADAHVANSLHRLAVGYSHTVERYMRGRDGPVKVSYLKHYPPHPRACMDWLENKRPQDWGRAAIKRKLQEAEDARDAAARRPPFLSNASLEALVLACPEAVDVPDPGPDREQSHIALPVVPTAARSAKRGELLSTKSHESWRRDLSARALRPSVETAGRPHSIALALDEGGPADEPHLAAAAGAAKVELPTLAGAG